MAEYVAYVQQQLLSQDGVDDDGNPVWVVEETFAPGDDISQADMEWTDEQWVDAVRRGKVVLKGSADDPNQFRYADGAVAVSTMQAEAVTKNASTVAADPNVDTDLEQARKDTGSHFVGDRTPLVETEGFLQEEFGPVARGTQRTTVSSPVGVPSGTKSVDVVGTTPPDAGQRPGESVSDTSGGDPEQQSEDDKPAKAAPQKSAPNKAAPTKQAPPKES